VGEFIAGGVMEQQQSFSHGLLYSVAPESLSELHIDADARHDEFDWDEHEAQYGHDSFTQIVVSFLKVTAVKWGLAKS